MSFRAYKEPERMRKAGVLSVGTPLACEDRLLRWISALVVFVLVAVATTADVDCGAAYTNFVERLGHRVHGLSASQLATIHRKALRIFDACETGHMDHTEFMFRRLEREFS
jgi:hypothetical protein